MVSEETLHEPSEIKLDNVYMFKYNGTLKIAKVNMIGLKIISNYICVIQNFLILYIHYYKRRKETMRVQFKFYI